MGRILLVSKTEQLDVYEALARKYNTAFEINDFYMPSVLDDEAELERRIAQYEKAGVPQGSTMHGAFYDVNVFSEDRKIREIAKARMEQSMQIARRLQVQGVVFHTNGNPLLAGEAYDSNVVSQTCGVLEELLQQYPEISIYMENMFDADPGILVEISKRLSDRYCNYGVCLDYAHASISPTPVSRWVRELAPYVRHLHINDNDLHRDLHLAVGEGQIDWDLFGYYYRTYFSQCSLLIETTPPQYQERSLQYLRERRILVEAEPEAEQLLEQIFHYMTQLAEEKGFTSTICLLTEMGRSLVQAERASFWYWDRAQRQYWTVAALKSERICVPEGTGIVGASIANHETICIDDPYRDERFNPEVDRNTGYVTRSILCMPVSNAAGEVIGAYQAINKQGERGVFTQRDVKRLTLAAVYCGKLLESHLLYHEAQMDPLTGLKNRRGFYEYYSDVLLVSLAQNPAGVIMCDIDFFKKVNDTYGHNAGDAVLMHVGDILQEELKGRGEVIRWGGEEFVLLLPEFSLTQTEQFAEVLRARVEAAVTCYGEHKLHITMSFGVASITEKLSADAMIAIVDERLYRAKAAGRNCVISAPKET